MYCYRTRFHSIPIGGKGKVDDEALVSSGLYEYLLKDGAAAENKYITDRMRQQKKKILHKLSIDIERSEYTSFSVLVKSKCKFL